MPELPDIVVYIEALEGRVLGEPVQRVRLASPFLLRSVDPPVSAVDGKQVTGLRRIGKRIVFELQDGLFMVLHLMIAGRLHWRDAGAALAGKQSLAAFDFTAGSLVLTEAGSKKRASLHIIRGEEGLRDHDPGGLEVLDASLEEFRAALTGTNHTLKRAFTDPRLFSGIGNAYSDEILHGARMSPVKWTQRLDSEEVERLFRAVKETLTDWIARLREDAGEGFPEKVTAFRKEMAVHGRYKKPCPVCGSAVQRIAYASKETNYCACCQTGGKLLADRSLSRLLKGDWPRTLEELEARRR